MELWIRGACGSAESVDLWSPVDLQSLWIQAPRSPGWIGAQAEPRIWSPGSTERSPGAILAPTGMAAYHINGNTIHSMILANEHRSLSHDFSVLLPYERTN